MSEKQKRHDVNAPRDGSPRVHSSTILRECVLGQFTDVAERCSLAETSVGDYTYIERHVEAIYADIGNSAPLQPMCGSTH